MTKSSKQVACHLAHHLSCTTRAYRRTGPRLWRDNSDEKPLTHREMLPDTDIIRCLMIGRLPARTHRAGPLCATRSASAKPGGGSCQSAKVRIGMLCRSAWGGAGWRSLPPPAVWRTAAALGRRCRTHRQKPHPDCRRKRKVPMTLSPQPGPAPAPSAASRRSGALSELHQLHCHKAAAPAAAPDGHLRFVSQPANACGESSPPQTHRKCATSLPGRFGRSGPLPLSPARPRRHANLPHLIAAATEMREQIRLGNGSKSRTIQARQCALASVAPHRATVSSDFRHFVRFGTQGLQDRQTQDHSHLMD